MAPCLQFFNCCNWYFVRTTRRVLLWLVLYSTEAIRIFLDNAGLFFEGCQHFLFVFATFPLAFCFARSGEHATSYFQLVSLNFLWIYVPTFLPFAMPWFLECIFVSVSVKEGMQNSTEIADVITHEMKKHDAYFIWGIFIGTLGSSLYFPFRSIIISHYNKNSIEKIPEGTFCLKPKYSLPRGWAHPWKLVTEWNLWAVIGFLFEALQHGYLTLPKDYVNILLDSSDLENEMGEGLDIGSWLPKFGSSVAAATSATGSGGNTTAHGLSSGGGGGDSMVRKANGAGRGQQTWESFQQETFTGVFWICFSCAFINVLLVVLRLVLKGDRLHRYKRFGMVWMIVYYLNGPTFVTLVTAFLSALSCDYSGGEDGLGKVVLKADTNIECWKGDHIYMASAALWAIAFYLTQATLMPSGTYPETMVEGLDVLFVPVYMQYHYFLKAVFSFCYVFMESELFGGAEWIRILLLTLINFSILFIMAHSYSPGPCPIAWINTYRNALFAMSVWSGVASLIYLYALTLIGNQFSTMESVTADFRAVMSDLTSTIDLRYVFSEQNANGSVWANGTDSWTNRSHPCQEYHNAIYEALDRTVNITATSEVSGGIVSNSTLDRFGDDEHFSSVLLLTMGLLIPFGMVLLGWCCSTLVPPVLTEVLLPVLVPVVGLLLVVLMAIVRSGGVGHQLILLLIMLAGWTAIFISAMLQRLSSKSANSVHYQIEEAFLELKFQLKEDTVDQKNVAVQARVLEPLIALTLSKDDADINLSMKYVPDMIKLTSHYNQRVQFQCAWGLANLSALGREGVSGSVGDDIAGHGRALREAIADAGGLQVSGTTHVVHRFTLYTTHVVHRFVFLFPLICTTHRLCLRSPGAVRVGSRRGPSLPLPTSAAPVHVKNAS
jgi:ABC-type multidrug transport system fused ATPase/permease subunit